MRKSISILSFLLFAGIFIKAQTPEVIKFADLQRIMNSPGDTTYIVNFWATWCIPCVKEFPSFQKFAKDHRNENVKVVMVSLDFKKSYESALVPFIKKHPVDGIVYLLDEPDYNSWINKINPDWEGEIPVTFMFNNAKKQRIFYPRDFKPDELEQAYTNRTLGDTTQYMTNPANDKRGKTPKNKITFNK
jgi:thiol-disulfide isomerase/thioredoxin